MGRWLFVGSSLFVIGALFLIDSPNPTRTVNARSLGGICEGTRDCRAGTHCIESDGILAGQCSAACAESSSCRQAFGDQALCLGNDLCARACTQATDCPNGTTCNVYGWCERSRD